MTQKTPAKVYNLSVNKKTKHADIDLFGTIGWSVWLGKFKAELRAAGDVKTITVRINTFGGGFYDGLPIFNLLREHSAHVTTRNIGYAVSMGSVLLLAGDTIEMAENSITMIHRAQGFSFGDAKQMRKTADVLETHERAALLPIYKARFGLSEKAVNKLLQKESWYTAQEALDAGLIDAISNPISIKKAEKEIKKNVGNEFSNLLENYQNPPTELQNRITAVSSQSDSFMSRIFGSPLFKNTDADQSGDDEMSPEQEEKLVTAIAKNGTDMTAAISKGFEDLGNKAGKANDDDGQETEEVTALKDKLATAKSDKTALAEKVTGLEAEVLALKKPDGTTKTPDNTGPSDEQEYSC